MHERKEEGSSPLRVSIFHKVFVMSMTLKPRAAFITTCVLTKYFIMVSHTSSLILSQSQWNIKYSENPHRSGAIPTPSNHYRPISQVSQQQQETVTADGQAGKSPLEMAKLSEKSLQSILKQQKTPTLHQCF